MAPYAFELPTTGVISFSDFCIDRSSSYANAILDATTARANVRAILKETKHSGGEKDYLRVIKTVSDYLPHLYGILACVGSGDLAIEIDPVFSWRSVLLSKSMAIPTARIDVMSLTADLAFTLSTLAFAFSNLATATLTTIGMYEYERTISDVERKAKDEKLDFAAKLLARASGIYDYISDTVLLTSDQSAYFGKKERPPELERVVVSALAKLSIADANQLAIRKLMTRSAYDSTLSPGPPLPSSHPPPALLAKLYFNCASHYSSAHSVLAGSKSKNYDVNSHLLGYLEEESILCSAAGMKWLGVDAGERPGKCGEAVALLKVAKTDLGSLKTGKLRGAMSSSDASSAKKDRLAEEVEAVKVFLGYYEKMNDSVHFAPVPSAAAVRSSIPDGKAAIEARPFQPPAPAFSPRRAAESPEDEF